MNYLLDRAREILGSDRKTAKAIGVTEQLISSIRHGRRNLTPYQAAKIAEIIGERWADHALPVLIDQARTPAEKDYWLGKLELLSTLIEEPKKAATLAIMLMMAAQSSHGTIEQERIKNQSVNHVYYVN